MAESADFTKKILVDVELKSEQIKKDLPALTQEIDRLTQSQKAAQKAGETSTKAYIDNASQLRNLKSELRDSNKYIDNVSKAINAENGTLQQNRAILSVITQDYVKVGEKAGVTTKQLNTFTQGLKEQEKQIGQTYRNVGNYEEAIDGLVEKLGGSLPVFREFQEGIKTVAGFGQFIPNIGQGLANNITSMFGGNKAQTAATVTSSFAGYKQFGSGENAAANTADTKSIEEKTVATSELTAAQTALTEATVTGTAATTAQTAANVAGATAAEGMAGATGAAAAGEAAAGGAAEGAAAGTTVLGVALTAVIGVVAVVIGGLIALKEYLADIAPVSDNLSNIWAGMKASFKAMANTIKEGDFSDLSKNMSDADIKARQLNQDILDLNRNMLVSDAATAEENDFIQVQLLKLRNIHTTADQAEKIFAGIQETAEKQYQRTWHLAFDGYRAYAGQIINAAGLTQKEYDKLLKGGVEYATELKREGKAISDELIKSLEEYQVKMVEANGIREQVTQRAENREQQRVQRDQQRAQAAAEKAERQHEKEAAALLEAENLRKQSLTRQLQAIYESYGSQVVAADQQYNNEITKLKKFVAQKLITQAEANRVEEQLTKEHNATITKIITDFRTQDETNYRNASNSLMDLVIKNIQNTTERSIEALKQSTEAQKQELTAQNDEIYKQLTKIDTEKKSFKGKELQELKAHEAALLEIIAINNNKEIALDQNTQDAIAAIRRKASEDAAQAVLQANVLKEKQNTNLFSDGGAEAAEKAQVTDKYDFEISEAARAGQSTVLLEQQKIDALKAINDKYRNEKIDYAVQAEQLVQQGVYDILQQGIQQQQQATLNHLEAAKSAELANTSLTGTQKQLINNKYVALENAAKLKAFKADQKLQAANIIINGAVGISKTIAEMGFLPALPFVALTAASTALALSKVLSAKPGFSTGGQFKSDGRGALLPGYSKHDNMNATLRDGEAVVVSEAMRAPWARNTISRINEMFGGRSFATSGPRPAFADGGIFTDGGNANRYYAQPVYNQEGLANSLAYQLINNFPPVQVDVKDINNQQAILAQTQNRVVL